LVKILIRILGVIVGHPPDAQERLNAYGHLLRVCITYQGQPASKLLKHKGI